MRIGIDCRTISNLDPEQEGVGRYTYELIKNLLKFDKKDKYILFFDRKLKDNLKNVFQKDNVEAREIPFYKYDKFVPGIYSRLLISAVINKAKVDVMHFPLSANFPITYKKLSIVTVHDLAIFKNPQWFSKRQTLSVKVSTPKALKLSQRVIVFSDSVKEEIKNIFKTPEEKIEVIPKGFEYIPFSFSRSEKEATLAKLEIRKPYILFFGTIDFRKNIEKLLEAFNFILKDKRLKNYKLVISGRPGRNYKLLLSQIKKLEIPDKVKFTGRVSNKEKEVLYEEAEVFACPSLYEGFCMPIIEALASSTPIVVSKIRPITDLVGEDSAILVNPEDENDIAQGIKMLLLDKDLQKRLACHGKKKVKRFNWDESARRTLRLYKKAARERAKKEREKRKKMKRRRKRKK